MKQFVFHQLILHCFSCSYSISKNLCFICAVSLLNLFSCEILIRWFFSCPLKTIHFLVIQQLYSFKYQKHQSCVFHPDFLFSFSTSLMISFIPLCVSWADETPGASLGKSNTTSKLFYDVNIVQSLRCISLIELGGMMILYFKVRRFAALINLT